MQPSLSLRCLLVSGLLSVACAPQVDRGGTAEAQSSNPLAKGTPAQKLTNAYLLVQSKLARDDYPGAHAAFVNVRTALAGVREVSPELRKRIEEAALAGAASKDIAGLRTAFAPLSDAMLAWLKLEPNPLGDALSVVHCPMARDGKGAKWLQVGTQLKNPYFGAEMLECGSIEATLTPSKKP
jgi:hypothetical protein